MLRLGEHQLGRTFLDNAAFIHEDDSIGDFLREVDLVGHDDHRAPFFGERADHLQHFSDQLRVEGRGGLVEEHELGLHGQGACDRDTLLLAARQSLGVGVGLVGHSNLLEHVLRPILGLLLAQAEHPAWRNRHVVHIAILQTRGHKPPVNTITAACGFNSLIIGMFGSVSTCLTGPVNAILSSGGRKETHYIAAVIIGLFAILFGLHSPMFTKFLLASPPAFIATLAGLALLRILESAFKVSFGGKFTLGALVSFLVTLTELTIFNIGAPFWGLVFGFAASWLLERDHFDK